MDKLKEIRNYKLFCLEHAISIDRLTKYDNFLSDNINFEKKLKELNIMIYDIKNEIKKLEYFDVDLESEKSNIWKYTCDFSFYVASVIRKIKKNIENSKDDKFFKIVYPEGYIRSLYPKIEIECDNFNRIHIGDIAEILKNIGVGKKCYKTMIKKLGFISSNYKDRTKDAELIWKSIIKEKTIYSFICNKKIISFSNNYDYEKILNIVKEFFKYEVINSPDEIIFDNDFEEKYKINKVE